VAGFWEVGMPFIEQIEPENSTGRLRKIYDAAMKRAGYVAGIIKIMSQDPRSAEGSMGFYGSLMKAKNELSPMRREMLAAVVSNVNDCFY
jgi:alkylhydroperoxidase family enzyme